MCLLVAVFLKKNTFNTIFHHSVIQGQSWQPWHPICMERSSLQTARTKHFHQFHVDFSCVQTKEQRCDGAAGGTASFSKAANKMSRYQYARHFSAVSGFMYSILKVAPITAWNALSFRSWSIDFVSLETQRRLPREFKKHDALFTVVFCGFIKTSPTFTWKSKAVK